jgi:hypothetical protein
VALPITNNRPRFSMELGWFCQNTEFGLNYSRFMGIGHSRVSPSELCD